MSGATASRVSRRAAKRLPSGEQCGPARSAESGKDERSAASGSARPRPAGRGPPRRAGAARGEQAAGARPLAVERRRARADPRRDRRSRRRREGEGAARPRRPGRSQGPHRLAAGSGRVRRAPRAGRPRRAARRPPGVPRGARRRDRPAEPRRGAAHRRDAGRDRAGCCPRHRAVGITPAVTKAAAGAIEHLPIAFVSGIPSALEHGAACSSLVASASTRPATRRCSTSPWPTNHSCSCWAPRVVGCRASRARAATWSRRSRCVGTSSR